jgi:hypothetical protein
MSDSVPVVVRHQRTLRRRLLRGKRVRIGEQPGGATEHPAVGERQAPQVSGQQFGRHQGACRAVTLAGRKGQSRSPLTQSAAVPPLRPTWWRHLVDGINPCPPVFRDR